jgi:hypothetical protein
MRGGDRTGEDSRTGLRRGRLRALDAAEQSSKPADSRIVGDIEGNRIATRAEAVDAVGNTSSRTGTVTLGRGVLENLPRGPGGMMGFTLPENTAAKLPQPDLNDGHGASQRAVAR